MNYLAHLLLAGPQAASQLGAMLGDFVKGPLDSVGRRLAPEIVAGIALHRRIDSFADAHPAFRASRHRVSAQRRRFSGVMVDMFYDHFLARHWRQFSALPLEVFTARTYALLSNNPSLLPPRLAQALPRMQAADWLASYRRIEAIGEALDRIGRHRLRRPNPLPGAEQELRADYAAYEADFQVFFADALAFSDACRSVWPRAEVESDERDRLA